MDNKDSVLPRADDAAFVMDEHTKHKMEGLRVAFATDRIGVTLAKDPNTGELVRMLQVEIAADKDQVLTIPLAIIHSEDYIRSLVMHETSVSMTGEAAKSLAVSMLAGTGQKVPS